MFDNCDYNFDIQNADTTGFFIGYSIHLILDSFTRDGIQPFWPLKTRSSGFIASGGRIEETLFFSLILLDVFL